MKKIFQFYKIKLKNDSFLFSHRLYLDVTKWDFKKMKISISNLYYLSTTIGVQGVFSSQAKY